MMIKSLSPNLMAEDVRKSVEFYKEVLGFELIDFVEVEGEMIFAILKQNEVELMIEQRLALIEEYPTLSVEKVYPSLSLFFRVEEIENLYALIQTKTLIIKALHTTFYETQEFAIADPDGCIITLAQK